MKPLAPHPFVADDDMPPDPYDGRQVCRCGLIGEPGDTHHEMPVVPEMAEHRRRAGEDE